MQTSMLVAGLVGVLGLVACGDDASTTTGAGGAGAGGSGAGAGPTTGTGVGGAGGASSTTGSSTGSAGGPACEDFVTPPDAADPVTVRLVNETAADLFVGDPTTSCVETRFFTLSEDSGDPPAVLDPYLDACEFSCEAVQNGACGCTAQCPEPTVVKITPGGSFEVLWPGYVYGAAQMPAACYGEGCEGTDLCALARPAPTSLARATASTALTCADDGICDCTADASGSCRLDQGSSVVGLAGDTLLAATTFPQGDVELVLTFSE